MMDYDRYENSPLVSYGPTADGDYHVYYRVCPKCGRYVKADKQCRIPEYQKDEPNASCKRCGRVQMEFCTWDYDEMEDAYAEHTCIYG